MPQTARIPLEKLDTELEGVFEAARYLRSNIVQGVHRRRGDAATQGGPEARGPQGERIALRIHRDTELGDNESIKRSSPFSSGDISTTAAAVGGSATAGTGLSDAAKERREKRKQRRNQLARDQSASTEDVPQAHPSA